MSAEEMIRLFGKTYRVSVATSAGIRSENQDSACLMISCDGNTNSITGGEKSSSPSKGRPDYLVAVLCDGMGGLSDGAEASGFIVAGLNEWAKGIDPASIDGICDSLSARVKELEGELIVRYPKSGTTLSAVVAFDGQWASMHIGDSRTYAVYPDRIWRTKDHSPVEEMYRRGIIEEDEMNDHPMSNVVSSYLGGGHADRIEHDVIEDGWMSLTLCSDGAFGYMDTADFHDDISKDLDADRIVKEAIGKGSKDNVSAIRIIDGSRGE